MGYELFVARRYLRSTRRNRFVPVITVISVLGVSVGIIALIVVLAVMNGFEDEVRSRIVGTNAHVILLSRDGTGIGEFEEAIEGLSAVPGVLASTPFIQAKTLLTAEGGSDAVVVRGVDPHREAQVSDVLDFMRPEGLIWTDAGDTLDSEGLPELVMGIEIAFSLGVRLGDEVMLASPARLSEGISSLASSIERFTVAGFFESGMYEYDASLVFVPLEVGQSLFGLEDRVTGIGVRITDMYQAQEVEQSMLLSLGRYDMYGTNWIELNSNLFVWMQTEKHVMFWILGLIILVAAFNIASTLIMAVMEKTRDIGVLMAMGASRSGVLRVFLFEGLYIGVIGCVIGCAGGMTLAHFLDRYKVVSLPSDVYLVDTLPIQMQAGDIAVVAAATLVSCLVASLYPAWQASRLDPVEAIRYD